MAKFKMTAVLLCALLLANNACAVVNKGNAQTVAKEEDNVTAEDRISNTYGVPVSHKSKYNEIAPVYGPPDLTGDYRPPKVYAPPPAERPPPLNFGSPRKPAQQYGPPKPQYGPPKPQSGPPKNRYGPPKQQFGPTSTSLFSMRPPKPQYGPPFKSSGSLPTTFSSAPSFGSKPGVHGSQIPLSVEAYGPPSVKPPTPFTVPKDYRPAPIHRPQPQYVPPNHGNSFGPPPPGVPAPPTPPDIKYDGWQPIAGSVNAPTQHIPANTYGPPNYNAENSDSSLSAELIASLNQNSGKSSVPSDSYGVPIHHPEAQNLKLSATPDSKGLPPPPLPHLEPLHVGKGPGDTETFKTLDTQYGPPSTGDVSGTQTTGLEHLPKPDQLTVNQQEESDGFSNFAAQNQQHSDSFGPSGDAVSNSITAHDDLTAQQLPTLTPGSFHNGQTYAAPLSPPSPPVNTYGPPPSAPFGGSIVQGAPGFQTGTTFHATLSFGKNGFLKGPGAIRPPFTPPAILSNNFVPPRNRPPLKFKEPVPSGLLASLHRYLPALHAFDFTKPAKNFGLTLPTGPQLPSLNPPVKFHQLPVPGNGVVFHGNLNSALAAPNANYGTPLSFNNFNTPAPLLTYGAPNFGPITPLVSETSKGVGNLYTDAGNTLSNTYGTPIISGPSGDCGFQKEQGLAPTGNDGLSHQGATDGQSDVNVADFARHGTSFDVPVNSLTSYQTPSVHELDLQINEQQKNDLKDSYGNPIGITFENPDQPIGIHNVPLQTSSSNLFPDYSYNSKQLSNEAVTASLTGQNYGENKNFASQEVEANQFLNSEEGSRALALATQGNDGFQIQGSKGIYSLQIQAADGGYGTENADGSIRHDQVLSNGLLEDILAAIEQPQAGEHIQVEGIAQDHQQLSQGYGDMQQAASSSIASSDNYKSQVKKDTNRQTSATGSDNSEAESSRNSQKSQSSESGKIALFINNDYSEESIESKPAGITSGTKPTEAPSREQ